MSVLWIMLGAAGVLFLAGRFYAPIIGRVLGERADRQTPAVALILATCWLLAHRRPIWYTLIPALFMLATSVTMLVRLLVWDHWPNWATKAPLAVTAVVVLAMTAGIAVLAAARWSGAARSAAATA